MEKIKLDKLQSEIKERVSELYSMGYKFHLEYLDGGKSGFIFGVRAIEERQSSDSPVNNPPLRLQLKEEQESEHLINPNIPFNVDDSLREEQEYVSSCCTSNAYGNIHELDGEHYGLCGKCKEHTDFVDINEDYNLEQEELKHKVPDNLKDVIKGKWREKNDS